MAGGGVGLTALVVVVIGVEVAEHPQIGHIPGGTVDVGMDPEEHGPHTVRGQGGSGIGVGTTGGGVGLTIFVVVTGLDVAEHPQIGHMPGGTVEVGTDPGEQGPHIV